MTAFNAIRTSTRLVTCGAFTPEGEFPEVPEFDMDRLQAAWREAMFALHLGQQKIGPGVVEKLHGCSYEVMPDRMADFVAGSTETTTTLTLLALARSNMETKLSWMVASGTAPLLPAMSLTPAMMTTTLGLRFRTSGRKRTSMCWVVSEV